MRAALVLIQLALLAGFAQAYEPQPGDLWITFETTLSPPVPAYLECTGGNVLPFTVFVDGEGCYPNGCGVLYRSHCAGRPNGGEAHRFACDLAVATDTVDWGALKARFEAP